MAGAISMHRMDHFRRGGDGLHFNALNLTGKRFGRLVAISIGNRANGKHLHWDCDCDCGGKTAVRSSKLVQGKVRSCGCLYRENLSSAGDRAWIGGRHTDKRGYVSVATFSTRGDGTKRHEREHRVVMEKHLGRKLHNGETVHHKNGIRNDNRIENLELWSTQHPYGQRVSDKVESAIEVLNTYKPEALAEEYKTNG